MADRCNRRTDEDHVAAGMSRRDAVKSLAAGVAVASVAAPVNAQEPLTGADIIRRAHIAAGGADWAKPRTLHMRGRAVFFPTGTQSNQIVSPDYRMWRTYPTLSADAHAANGMVRIDAKRADGSLYFQIAFDGVDSYDAKGPIPGAAASQEWSENFGFGIIRFALNAGFNVDRLPDDEADGRPIYIVRVNDPRGGKTLFGITKDEFQVVWLGFATPKGWHERRYSNFYRNPGVNFTQPGRVRLFYDGVKQNEIWWTAYELNQAIPNELYQLGRSTQIKEEYP